MPEKSTAAHAEGARVNVNVGASAAPETPSRPTNTWAKAMPIVYILSGLGGGGAAQLAIGARVVVPSPVAVASASSDEIKDLKHTLERFMRTEQELRTVDNKERADLCAQLKAIKGDLDEIIKLHPRRR